MKKQIILCLVISLLLATYSHVWAAPLKVFVARMNAVGVPDRDEMQTTMQSLLASRLNGESLVAVNSSAEADVIVTGSYVVFGKVFSFDAVAVTTTGKTLTRAYVQGEGQDELIPVIGKLAEKLSIAITQSQPASAEAKQLVTLNPVISQKPVASEGDVIKIDNPVAATVGSWRSPPIEGVFNLIAAGNKRADGSRDLFLADDRRLLHYRQSDDLKLLATKEFKVFEKIIALDFIDSGKESVELYLTIMSNEELASQIYEVRDGVLKQIAKGLPYFFRSMRLPGTDKRLYVQKTGNDRIFSGEVYEAERKGSEILLKNSLPLPKFTAINSFAKFKARADKPYTVQLMADNYLVVHDEENREIWRSSERYGGSDLFIEKRTQENMTGSTEEKPKTFLNQRIQMTSAGEMLVVRNDALWFLGKSRSYKNGKVMGLSWNGDGLEAKWQTRNSAYYVPDFAVDESQKELLLIEVVKSASFFSKGSSAISIKKIE